MAIGNIIKQRGEDGHWVKPPLGCRPAWLVREIGYDPRSRYEELTGAIVRYLAGGLQVNPAWWSEWRELALRIY